ncbi:MAG: DUF4982 domain-containing protein [Paludibacter sp.]
MWNDVVYQPGEIKVVAYNTNNEKMVEQVIQSSRLPCQPKLTGRASHTTVRTGHVYSGSPR